MGDSPSLPKPRDPHPIALNPSMWDGRQSGKKHTQTFAKRATGLTAEEMRVPMGRLPGQLSDHVQPPAPGEAHCPGSLEHESQRSKAVTVCWPGRVGATLAA